MSSEEELILKTGEAIMKLFLGISGSEYSR
jgi:hypothetical protein